MPICNRAHFALLPAQAGATLPQILLNAQVLADEGPVLICEVRVDVDRAATLAAAGAQLPQAKQGRLLVDTGASKTCIEKDILDALGIPPVSQMNVATPQGTTVQGVYPCGIAFPGSGLPSIERVFVLGADLKAQNIIGLLGRDVLSTAILVYNGSAGNWSLAF